MIRRLDIKIVLILLVTVLVPLGVSVYLVLRAVDTSLGLGLNKELASALEESLEIRRQYIRELKQNMEQGFHRISGSHALRLAVDSQDDAKIRSALLEIVEQTSSLHLLRLADSTGHKVEARAREASGSGKTRSFTMEENVTLGRYTLLEGVFLADADLEKSYREAGETFLAYKTLVDAPPDYLKNLFILVYLAILSGGVILSVLGGIVLSRHLVRRIHKLSSATRSVAEGDLSIRVASGSADEVGELVESFNSMVSELSVNRARIEYLQKISAWQEMARRLAHEIKNPLTPIQLATQQLKEKYPGGDPEFGRLLEQSTEIIQEEVATLRRLTSDFASFAKLPEIAPTTVELGEFLEECRSSLESVVEQAGVNVSFQDQTGGVKVKIDRVMMKRVIDNLVRNAAEAIADLNIDKKEIRITAKKRRTRKKLEAEIRVEDNGPGVLPEHHPSIFDPYFTTKSEGTGLGLAISKKVVLEHGGRIWLDDKVERGAAFVVVLPALS